MAKRTNKKTMTASERGFVAGVAWIQTEGAADCTDAEVADQARDLAGFNAAGEEADYVAGFLSGVESMTVRA
jgi:hypothetical protein